MTKAERREAELAVIRVLKYWQDADIFSLTTKKKIAEMTVATLEKYFKMERGLQMIKKIKNTSFKSNVTEYIEIEINGDIINVTEVTEQKEQAGVMNTISFPKKMLIELIKENKIK